MPPVSPVLPLSISPQLLLPLSRKFLNLEKNDSSPGPDSIYYGYLKHLPCAHYFLATLYSKIFFAPILVLLDYYLKFINPAPPLFRLTFA